MQSSNLFREASRQYKKGNYLHALKILNALIGPETDARTYALLGKVLESTDMKEQAAIAFAVAGNQPGPKAEDYLKQAMQLHFECGNDDQALALGNKLFQRALKDPDIAYIITSLFIKRGSYTDTLHGLRRVLLKSDNQQHIVAFLKLVKIGEEHLDDYILLQEALRKFENVPIANPLVLLLNAVLSMYALYYCDYPVARKSFKIISNELTKGNYNTLALSHSFYIIHLYGNDKLSSYGLQGRLQTQDPAVRTTRKRMIHEWSDDRLRIGYVSSDFFSDHATMKLMGNVLERHDRKRFEIVLFCHTSEKNTILNTFDREKWGEIVTIRDSSNDEAAHEIRSRNIDILVDLKGYTRDNRLDLFNKPCAPIHVAWLGYPTTAVNADLDYVIGDRFVLPDSAQSDWNEVFCRLPETYQPNDPVHRPLPRESSRAEANFFPGRFIFASFNSHLKITPDVIDLWCRILHRTPDSILWLFARNNLAKVNLMNEFRRQDIAADRIIFMTKEQYADHLTRMQLVDLGLDTFPCNGHTTTSEQLWAGLPVVTVKGTHFASRVTESLLNAIGLPELVAADQDAYVEMAVELYHDREKLNHYKKRLEAGRFMQPLFDAERFCRHLESAYTIMADRAKAGLEPAIIDVPALPPRESSFEGE